MAIVKFNCDSGANIHSNRNDTFDTETDLGLDKGEWEEMSEEDKLKEVEFWANESLEIWYDEV